MLAKAVSLSEFLHGSGSGTVYSNEKRLPSLVSTNLTTLAIFKCSSSFFSLFLFSFFYSSLPPIPHDYIPFKQVLKSLPYPLMCVCILSVHSFYIFSLVLMLIGIETNSEFPCKCPQMLRAKEKVQMNANFKSFLIFTQQTLEV